MFKMYKVLKRFNGKLYSPFQIYEYKPGKEYVCDNFDSNPSLSCSYGYYATRIEGLIYSFYHLPGYYEVWEVEVGGKKVEIDPFKRRYERIRLIRQVPFEEVKKLALAEEEKVGYKLAEALFPVNPFKIKTGPITKKEIALLKQWISSRASVWNSISDSVWGSVRASVRASIWHSVWNPVKRSVRVCIRASIYDLTRDSVGAYISSLFPNIKKWEYIDHPEGENPFQPCIDLWHRGLVPGFDGKRWRLYAGEKAEIVWEGTEKILTQ